MDMKERIIDIHSHILPNIDDGSRNWDMTMEMIQTSVNRGVTHIVATPHFLPWRIETSPEQIQNLCREAQERAQKELGLDVTIYPGQEIMYHSDILNNLKEGKIQTINNTDYILVEFDIDMCWRDFKFAVQNITRSRYKPILAHVERYKCLQDSNNMEEILHYPVKMQVNARSLAGGIFNKKASWCHRQIKEGRIHFLASDMHDHKYRPPFDEAGLAWTQKKMSQEDRKALLQGNAAAILQSDQ